MSESTLPYLKEIADSVKRLNSDGNRKQSEALQNINKTIGTYNVKNESLIIGGNENTEAIAEAVKTGLVEEVIEGEGSQAHPVEKSVFDVMKEAFVQVFREAMFSVVGEGSAAHEESIFQQIKDTLADIKTAQQTIATALAGSGGSGLSAQVGQIVNALIDNSNPNAPVNRIDTMTTVVNGQGSNIAAIKTALYPAASGQPDTIEDYIENMAWKVYGDPGGNTIHDNVNTIKDRLYTNADNADRTAGRSLWELEKLVNNIDQKITNQP